MVKKQSQQEIASPIIVDHDQIAVISEDDQTYKELSNKLVKIRDRKGIIGYIMRGSTSAVIDLKETEKIVDYALFSYQVLDSSREISDLFELGDVKSVLIEGKESKAICINIEGNKISIFMEKKADETAILKKISP